MQTKKTPLAGGPRGIKGGEIGYLNSHFVSPASIREGDWWGAQACTCRGAGLCLCCHRWRRVLDRFAQRGIVAATEVTV